MLTDAGRAVRRAKCARMKIAWYGTGLMGAGFVEALRARGEDVVVYNRTASKAEALERFGARATTDPREAARGRERIHLMINDDASVDALLDEIADVIEPGTIVIDHTTVAPHPTIARFAKMAARRIAFLHAPVFMAPAATRAGTGVMMVAGPQATFDRARDALEKMTGHLWYVGERVDKAATLKLVGNEMLFFITAALADGYAIGRGGGLSPMETFELFEHFKPAAAIDFRGKLMAEGSFEPAHFELSMARKDARLMLETAAAGDVPVRVLPAIVARMDELLANGHGARDLAVLGLETARTEATR
ncbi:MAG: NAD(P)-dependent oxidoreductase [Vulcanimicrobiaceae bacterium]